MINAAQLCPGCGFLTGSWLDEQRSRTATVAWQQLRQKHAAQCAHGELHSVTRSILQHMASLARPPPTETGPFAPRSVPAVISTRGVGRNGVPYNTTRFYSQVTSRNCCAPTQ
jgi:hypothetical protein